MASTQSSSSYQRSGSTTKTAIVPGMMSVYNQLLGLNQQNYENILTGYQQGQQMLANSLNQVYQGYNEVEAKTMRLLGVDGGGWGVATPAANAIRQGSTKTQGETQQAMINAGLGNTTVLTSMRNQNQLQTNQAYGELGSKLADYAAGYASQIGLARQQAMLQGASLQSGLTQSYLGNLSGFKFQNTAGDLTGTFSRSWSEGGSQSQGMSTDPIQMGGGRSSGGGAAARRAADPTMYSGPTLPYQPFVQDLQAINYAATRPQAFGYSGGSNILQLAQEPAYTGWGTTGVNPGPMTAASGQTTPPRR